MELQKKTETIEIDLLLKSLFQKYGYDFRNYAKASLKRRIALQMNRHKLEHISEMIPLVLHDPLFFDEFLRNMSITVTDMFRDPLFFLQLRKKVIPILKTYPYCKVWVAGCATGEEVYSLAIILAEEGYYERTRIYATDYNKQSLATAEEGIYPLEKIRNFTQNYLKAGGKEAFSSYYLAKYKSARFHESLRKNIVFAHHNLAGDGVFGEMNLILCRNVLIYFNKDLQDKVLTLFDESLRRGGFLCLGTKESISFSHLSKKYEEITKREKIFKKMVP